MSAWGCPHEVDGLCDKLAGAFCRPGIKGCVLAGKVEFADGKIPAPVWPEGPRTHADDQACADHD
jgi:hypothetical protein